MMLPKRLASILVFSLHLSQHIFKVPKCTKQMFVLLSTAAAYMHKLY